MSFFYLWFLNINEIAEYADEFLVFQVQHQIIYSFIYYLRQIIPGNLLNETEQSRRRLVHDDDPDIPSDVIRFAYDVRRH